MEAPRASKVNNVCFPKYFLTCNNIILMLSCPAQVLPSFSLSTQRLLTVYMLVVLLTPWPRLALLKLPTPRLLTEPLSRPRERSSFGTWRALGFLLKEFPPAELSSSSARCMIDSDWLVASSATRCMTDSDASLISSAWGLYITEELAPSLTRYMTLSSSSSSGCTR